MFSGENERVLADVGLDEAQLDARQRGAGRRREPERAEGGDERERERGEARRSKIEPALATRHSVAGAAKMAMVRNVSPCRPTSEAI